VPLYSQIADISSVAWKQKGCGVADVAMIVEFYKPNTTTVQEVLEEALSQGAYQKNVGWKHSGLAALAVKYGLVGKTVDLSYEKKETAYSHFKNTVKEGPVIASIHRGFDPKSPYGHLVVITGFDDEMVYFNDPGKRDGIRKVPVADFMKGWKKRLIVIREPEKKEKKVALESEIITEPQSQINKLFAKADINYENYFPLHFRQDISQYIKHL
jgi:ABC-type bacteriocin/lantibiotic exporter with double-glycine peptidase domain